MKIETNKSLQSYNTFGIAVTAKYFAEITSTEEFKALVSDPEFKNENKLILGGGSNILFTKNFDGLVIKNSIAGINVVKEDIYHTWVKAGAGEPWHPLVLFCVAHNLAGIENLSLIPGCVGAGPMQNIGAYGVEIKDTCEEVEAMNMLTGEKRIFSNADCEFGYRESVFKHKLKDQFLITAVTLRLNKIFKPHINYGDIKRTLEEMRVNEITIKAVSDAVIKIRSTKLPDPKVIGNAGSFFKNPVVSKKQFNALIAKNPLMPNYPQKGGEMKIPAGWLIEQCGWKGKVVGHTGAHKSQALVLVNYGDATGDEIYNLALDIQKSVLEKFGIEITPEVNLI
ncbi:MAG: UDP-N-acetylmuramate dehydrogenase [Chitinophagaceae bacterium]|nr:UDP-N-acetylmuramate dehydrogenase [Chitinophagaceae bacterium]